VTLVVVVMVVVSIVLQLWPGIMMTHMLWDCLKLYMTLDFITSVTPMHRHPLCSHCLTVLCRQSKPFAGLSCCGAAHCGASRCI
jgi:hypothetical protein